MVTAVKGDRESKEAAVYQALDQAFINRISRIFDAMCDSSEPDQAAARPLATCEALPVRLANSPASERRLLRR